MEKRTRKQRFSPQEIKVLLTRVAEHKEIITNKQLNEFVVQKKKIIWEAITEDVNNADDYAPQRTIGDVKKKWNDMKSAVHRYRLELRKHGGGGRPKVTPSGYVGTGRPVPPPREPAFYAAIMEIIRDDPYTLMNGNGGVLPLHEENGLDLSVTALGENSEDSDGGACVAERRISSEVKRETQSPVYSHGNSSNSGDESLSISIAATINTNVATTVNTSSLATLLNKSIVTTVNTMTGTTKPLAQQSHSISHSACSTKSSITSITPLFTPSQPFDQRVSSFIFQPSVQVSTSPTLTHIPLQTVVLPQITGLPHISSLPHATPSQPGEVQYPPSHLQFKRQVKRKADQDLCVEPLWNAYLESEIELNTEKIKLERVRQEYYMKKMETLDKGNFQL